ncbi:MAG: hypothetical protein V2B19_14535 [Pseudomonadota bacterium]
MKLLISILLAGVVATTCGTMPARYDPMTDNEKHLKEAVELIKAFEKEMEPERLREASMALENVNLRREHNAQIRHKLRSDCLEWWLTILQTIDKNLDSSFDPEDVPQLSVMPPRIKGDIQLPPGAAPALIDDPKAREEYEKAIKDNRAKLENYPLQTQLRELNEVIPGKVDSFIRRAFTSSDHDEVKATIDRIIESQSRKKNLYRLIESQSTN